MDDDAEALVHGRLGRDPKDARELVLQRARPVGLDVRGREQQALAAHRQEGLQRRLVAGGDRHGSGARVALGVEDHLVERARLQDLALLAGRRLQDRSVGRGQCVGQRLPLGPPHEGGELQQLEVAHNAVGDVEVGVEAQLAQARADARDALQELVAQRLERGLQRLVGAEQLFLAVLPLRHERHARLLRERRGWLERAAVCPCRVGEHEPLAGSRHRDMQQPPHLGDVRLARVGRQLLVQQRVRDRLDQAAPGAGHPRGLQPEDVHVAEGGSLRAVHRHHGHAVRPRARFVVLLAQPGVRDGGRVAGELARRRLGRPAHVGARQITQPRKAHEPLDHVRLRGEQLLAAQPKAVDQAVHEEVGPRRVQRRRRRTVDLQEGEDPLARLRGKLRGLRGSDERRHHVELAPARDLHAAGEVDRTQLDRRPRKRPHDRASVGRVD